MKRNVLKTVVLLLSAVLPLTLQAVNTITYTATYDVNKVTTGTDTLGGVTYVTVNYDGLYNGGNPGAPSLPVDYIRFSVPYNATNFTVSATLSNSMVVNIPHLVYPCQEPRMFDSEWSMTLPDNSIYNSNDYYPLNNAWVVDEGFLAGENHIVTVAVMPVSFRYRKTGAVYLRQLRKSGTVNLTLSYDLCDSLAMYPIVRRDTVLRNEGHQLARGLVVNPDSVIAFAPHNPHAPAMSPPLEWPLDSLLINTDSIYFDVNNELRATYPYMIVTTPELSHSLRRLAALKRQKGYGVRVLPTNYIYNHYASKDGDYVLMSDGTYEISDSTNEGKIRAFLRHTYEWYDTRYLLLVGKDVPFRTHVIYGSNVPTDWYYSDLNSNILTGTLDFEPEIFPGRIMARTPEEINNYTDKLLRYELNPGHGDAAYLKNALFVEGRDFLGYFKWFMDSIADWFNFDTIRIREIVSANYPKASDVINYINANPVGFMSIFNHGSPGKTKVYGSSEDNHQFGPQYYIYNQYHENDTCSGLNFLSNKNTPAIFYSPSCYTIDYNHPYTTFGDSFITGKDYGGPIYIGNTTDMNSEVAKYMEMDFLMHLRDGYYEIGKADALSKLKWINDEKYRMAHNVLGDPLLEMWTDVPGYYENVTVTRTDNSVTVAGIGGDSNIVAYYDNDGKIGKKTFNAESITLSGVSPNSTIMLYKHNCIPYIAPLMLQNTTLSRSQYVIASNVTAGSSIDSIRTPGDVTIPAGVEYEIEANGVVRLEDGFSVARGAIFAVYPSSF